jgi:hypothetical protein
MTLLFNTARDFAGCCHCWTAGGAVAPFEALANVRAAAAGSIEIGMGLREGETECEKSAGKAGNEGSRRHVGFLRSDG